MFSSNDSRLIEKLRDSVDIKSELEIILSKVQSEIDTLKKLQNSLNEDYENKKNNLAKLESSIDIYKKETLAEIDTIIIEKTKGFPWLTDAICQYFELLDLGVANYFDYKKWAAKKAAEAIREISKQKTKLRKSFLYSRNLLKYYEALFPWLNDFADANIDDTLLDAFSADELDEESDPVQYFVTKGEYEQLNETERNQRALDRYWKKKKTPWQIGRDYERYIGYLFESNGWTVNYQGIEKGLEDLGRDLICKKGNEVKIVQCKYWRVERTIHEKHINQLFGTTVEYFIKNTNFDESSTQLGLFPELLKSNNIRGSFYATCSFSDTSKKFAQLLGIELHPNVAFEKYPSIKCNISRRDGSKIYHLPFDQQYDGTIIEQDKNEFYASTVDEAEKYGFRRAWRWRGN
ncbi:MAG: restriction endonuclease [Melioribacteraceae bacterium]|nr:restriction endonuclease [Melioribacteraceae bacterium]MCF8264421.1 restriction endonuclease [Melioribacteraceae bacterium]